MDRYPGYESMLTRVEHMKMQVKAQLPTEYSQTVDNMVAFVLDQVNQCCDVATLDVATDTAQDHPLSGGPVARADDTRIEVNEHVNTVNPQVNHQREAASGSITNNEQTVSPPSPPTVTQSTIPANIEVKVEDESNGQSVQLCEWIKKEEDEDDHEEQLFYCCDCGGEGCEECRVKLEIKEEFDESGETELGGSSAQGCTRVKKEEEDSEGEGDRPKKMLQYVSSGQLVQHFKCVKKEEEDGGEYVMECDCEDCETCRVKREMKEELDESGETGQGCTRVKKEEGEDGEGERPKKIRRMDRVVRNVPVGLPSSNIISINVDSLNDQMSTSSTNSLTIEEQIRPSQSVTFPLPSSIVTPTQSSASSAQHFNEPLRDGLFNTVQRMDNVVYVDEEELDREQIDQEDEEDGDQLIEGEDTRADGGQQVLAENFVKQIEPADELGNRFVCDYRACGKRTKRQWDLMKHIRTHTGEKRYKCSVAGCDRAYFQKCNLDDHFRTHTGQRPFVCETCNATFAYHRSLVIHLRTHTGTRPFVCTWPDCGQAFISSSHLHSHSQVHSNERQFVCDVMGCTKVYKHKVALRRHQKTQHN